MFHGNGKQILTAPPAMGHFAGKIPDRAAYVLKTRLFGPHFGLRPKLAPMLTAD
jgi:hypothetical protein